RCLMVIAARRGLVVPSLVADVKVAAAYAPDDVTAVDTLPPAAPERPLLTVRDLEVHYDGVPVLFGGDLDVGEGEVVALLGTNGAGKSTVLKAFSGLVSSTGSVRFRDDELTGRASHHVAETGIIQAPGGHGVFPSLTV